MNIDKCRKLISLEQKKRALEEEVKSLNKVIAGLMREVCGDMAEDGLKNVSLESGERLTPAKKLYVNKRGGVSTDQLTKALEDADLEWLLKPSYSPSGLKEYVATLDEESRKAEEFVDDPNELLPPELKEIFSVYWDHKITFHHLKENDDGEEGKHTS